MRLRPIGPGIGGLYYSPMLQNAHTRDRISAYSRTEIVVDAGPSRSGSPWQAIKNWLKPYADRVVRARMAQADREIALVRAKLYPPGPSSASDWIGSRYY